MLRNSFLKETLKEGKNNENKYAYADEDENYMLHINRPMTERSIADIPASKIDQFVDGILTDKKVSNVLFSSAATKEINILKKSNEKMNLLRKFDKKKTSMENNPTDIVNNRKKKEMIEECQGIGRENEEIIKDESYTKE